MCNTPKIIEFRDILNKNNIPWLFNRGKIVFCKHGYVMTVDDLMDHLTLWVQLNYLAVEGDSFFNAEDILPHIEKKYGGRMI